MIMREREKLRECVSESSERERDSAGVCVWKKERVRETCIWNQIST